ncbi:MAG: MFS transporter, partial [Silicimonas sp.]|nr:MFS transporter [Silicimonas sp.]
MPADTAAGTARSPISRVELIALMGMLTATVAFSIDAMLPALPEIGVALNPAEPQRAQLVIAAFVLGLGVGTLFTGPLSDAFGRRPVAVAGAVIYSAAALYAATADSLDAVLVARAVQGLGAAGPRVVTLAIIRDLFAGRQMARITSYVMMVFTLVPVLAPSLGAGIAWAFGWRAIFLSFAVFSFISITWLLLRQ